MRNRRALAALVSMLFLTGGLVLLPAGAPDAGAATVRNFAGGAGNMTVVFPPGGGTDDTVGILLPRSSFVLSAAMNISGGPSIPGTTVYPETLSLDAGADGTAEWAWGGTGGGAFGRQATFADGTRNVSYRFQGPGTDLSARVKLPTDAVVRKAGMAVTVPPQEYLYGVNYTASDNTKTGYSVAALGDVNRDGFMDYAAGAPGNRFAFQGNGYAYIFLGNATPHDSPDYTLASDQVYDLYGWSVAGAGDVNGDGYDDIIVGDRWYDPPGLNAAGGAFIYFGGRSINDTPDVSLYGAADGDEFGYSVAGVGDVNGDNFDDVLVGAAENSSVDYSSGSAYLFFGGGPMNTVPDINLTGLARWDSLGTVVAGAGDLNNDSRPDFLIGAPGVNSDKGAVYIYYGGPGLDAVPDLNLTPNAGDYFGSFAAGAGDLDGDGFDDIGVMNAYNEVWVYHGGRPMDTNRDRLFTGEADLEVGYTNLFGYGIASPGDLNGDNYDELLIGAGEWDQDTQNYNKGRAYLYYGGASMDTAPEYIFTGEVAGERLGRSVAGPGDVNGDGFADLVLGADMAYTPSVAGKVYLKMYTRGVRDISVSVAGTGTTLWNRTGYFTGTNASLDLSQALNAAMKSLGPSHSDPYGARFTNLTLNTSAGSRGNISIDSIEIVYDLTLPVPDFSSALNAYMQGRAPGAGGNYTVPVRLSSATAGSVRLDGLAVLADQAPRGVPPAGRLTLPEGSANPALADLRTLFADDLTPPEGLVFSLGNRTGGSFVNLAISGGRYLSADAFNGSADVNWTGTVTVQVSARDARGLVSDPVNLTIEVANEEDAPVITSVPPATAMEGVRYEYSINATDGDRGDVLRYSLVSGPAGMAVNTSMGRLEWVPALGDLGERGAVVSVSDGNLTATQPFTITVSLRVTPGNRLPVVSSAPPVTATVGVTYRYQVNATDPDGDALSYTLAAGRPGMALNATSGLLSWLPQAGDAGTQNVSINVSDGKDRTFQNFAIAVSGDNPNRPPEISGSPPARAFAGTEYRFIFAASDPDAGDRPVFELLSGPEGMRLDPGGKLSWTPSPAQVGSYGFTVGLTDGKATATRGFSVEVFINHPPAFNSTPQSDGTTGREYRYRVVLTDTDAGDAPVVQVARGPEGMRIDNATGELVWLPARDQWGAFDISLRAWDGKEATYQNFTLVIRKGTGGSTVPAGTPAWILAVIVLAAAAGAGAYILVRKRRAAATGDIVIDDVFLIYRDGRLMSHHTRRLKPETDGDIITAMLTAIQDFVKQSIPTEGEVQKPIREIVFGEKRILVQHGKFVYIAAVVSGGNPYTFTAAMRGTVDSLEARHGEALDKWSGEYSEIDAVKAEVKELLNRGSG